MSTPSRSDQFGPVDIHDFTDFYYPAKRPTIIVGERKLVLTP
jgi:hypothetical protein